MLRKKTETKRLTLIFSALLISIAVFGLVGIAEATDCGGCGSTITSSCTLQSNLSSCPGDGLIIGADGVTIDGGHHTITGSGSNYGINDAGGYNGITIENFGDAGNNGISNFGDGIYLSGVVNSFIQNNIANANISAGIYLNSSNSNTLTNNTTNLNNGSTYSSGGNAAHAAGIYLRTSSYNYLGLDNTPGTGNTANSNSNTGIFIEGGTTNHLNYNTTNSNGLWGILSMFLLSDYSDNNIFFGNTADLNGAYGIQTDWGVSDTISNNTANSNNVTYPTTYSDGIYLYASITTTIENNTVENNLHGIRIRQNAHDNIVKNNTIKSNTYGIYIATSSSSNTLITNNTINSNTSDGIYLNTATSTNIFGNTFYNTASQLALDQLNNSTGTTFEDNIVYSGKYVSVASGSQTSSVYNYNDYYGCSTNCFNWLGTNYNTLSDWYTGTGSGQDANSKNSDPLFTNAAGDNFSLQSTSSVIDTGVDVDVNTDYAGNHHYDDPAVTNTGSAGSYTKNYVDMGAYEYVIPPDPTLASVSFPSQSTWYNSKNPTTISFSSPYDILANAATTDFRYLVNQTQAATSAQVQAGTLLDGAVTFDAQSSITTDGTWYVHVIAQNKNDTSIFSNNFNTYTINYDGTPPTIIGTPSNMTIEATSSSGAVVNYTAPTATDLVDGTDAVSCSPSSGSTFPLGTTTVNCSSKDAANNSAIPTSFNVTVKDTTAPTSVGISSITADSIYQLTITADIARDTVSGLAAAPYQFQRNSDTPSAYQSSNILTDTNLSPNTQYTYKVKAKDVLGNESAYSLSMSRYTLAPTPTNLAATASRNSVILVVDSLSNNSSGSSGYYFADTTEGTVSSWITTNTWQDTNLSCGTSYIYSVKYRNGDGIETNTIFITVSTSACGGGGSGLLFFTPKPVANATNATPPIATSNLLYIQQEIQKIQGLINSMMSQGSAPTTQQPTPIPTQHLMYGDRNVQVVLLQDTLKKLGFFPQTIKSSGIFGLITLRAV